VRARRVGRRLIEEVEVTGLFLLLLLGLGLGSRGGAAATAAAAAAAAATAAAADGGELGRAFLDQLSDILAVDGGEESRELGIVDLRGDCVFGKKEERASARRRWFCATGDGSNARGGRGTRRARGRAEVDHASAHTGSEDSLDVGLRGGVLASELRLLSRGRWTGKRVSGKP
jgi:hypothetical protein